MSTFIMVSNGGSPRSSSAHGSGRRPSNAHPMKRLRASIIAALVAVSAFVAAATANASPSSPESARLAAMCGTWDVAMTFWFRPGGPGVTTKGTSTIRPLFEGLFIEEKIDGTLSGAPFTTLAWTAFNTATHQYEATRIASTSPSRYVETGGYDEKAKQFELKADYVLAGDTWHERTLVQQTSADAMSATTYLRFGTVPEWKAVEITYTRTAK